MGAAASGTLRQAQGRLWAVTSGGYRQSATTNNTNAYRSQAQNQLLAYQWKATYSSGTNAGLYLFASAGTGAERGNSYRVWQDATSVKIYEASSNVATQRANFAAANAQGQTHTYQALYDPLTGKLQVWRDNIYLGSWTDTTPLTTGSYLSLRTDGANVLFDDLVVSEVVKYYEAGGQRVALRKNGALSYLFGDHLGSTSVTANSSGTRTGELWYKPWGEYRGTAFGTTPTTYRFTGQREDSAIGLYYYGARYYDSTLGRFIQPDTIVPEPGNPQALNRYSYTLNNPLKYTDPSGHFAWFVAVPVGALIGAGVTYGFQVAANISQNGLTVQAFTDVNWAAVGGGAVAGAVGVATFGVATAGIAAATGATGIGLGNMALSGALSGVISGQAGRATENLLTGKTIGSGLGDPQDILVDAVVGGGLAFLGGAVDRAIISARHPSFYTRYIGDGELTAIQQSGGILRGGRPGETYFTIDHYTSRAQAAQRLALPRTPDYRIEFEVLNQPRVTGPERVAPSFRPFRIGWGIQ
jgi:RHS repeat-associated protein